MAIYLKNDKIKGTVTTAGFQEQIELDSCSFGAGRAMVMSKRGDTNRGHAEPNLSELDCTRAWDPVSSSLLLQDALAGVADHKVTISFTTTSKNVVLAYLTYELEEVVVSSYSSGAGGDSHPSESFRLNYTKLTVTPYEVKDGKAVKKTPVVYSLPEMKANG
jgi:type VI secretion system secreted protein Hcp